MNKKITIALITSATLAFASSESVATLTDIKEALSILIDFQRSTQSQVLLFSDELNQTKSRLNETDKLLRQLQREQKQIKWMVNFSDCTDLKFKENELDKKIADFINKD